MFELLNQLFFRIVFASYRRQQKVNVTKKLYHEDGDRIRTIFLKKAIAQSKSPGKNHFGFKDLGTGLVIKG